MSLVKMSIINLLSSLIFSYALFMLQIEAVAQHNEHYSIRSQIDVRSETLVVADLHAKLGVQNHFLRQHGFIEGDFVLRANELWVQILAKTRPDVRVISSTLARTLIMQWLDERNLPWARTAKSAAHVFKYIQQLLPVISNKSSDHLMKSWLSTHPHSLTRWGNWFHLALQFWKNFESLNLLPSAWVSAYLSSAYKGQKVWDKRIIFDLGCELSTVESDLLLQMQNLHDIKVIQPNPPWASEYSGSQLGYRILASKSLDEKEVSEVVSFKSNVHFLRFSTMVSEVKAVTAQVRQWLDSGVDLSEIVVLAPDIEVYWTPLRFYFEQEGIPVDKPIVAPLISRVEISRWLSDLRLNSRKVSYEDLELSEFKGGEEPQERFEVFCRIFQNVYDREDLKRLWGFHKKFLSLSGESSLNRDEFIVKSLQFWNLGETKFLEELLNRLFQDCSSRLQLKWNQWIMYIEELCAKVEVRVSDSQGGLVFTNISWGYHFASHGGSHQYMYIMGLSETALKGQEGTSIELDEILKIYQDIGYMLDSSDNKKIEFQVQWLLDGDFKEAVVSFSLSHLSGSIEGPSRLWLQGAIGQGLNIEKVEYPQPSRWDYLQLSSLEDLVQVRGWSQGHLKSLAESLITGSLITGSLIKERPQKRFQPKKKPTLSVTYLEAYLKCPFIFSARKLFGLENLPAVDIDVDALTKGRWMHELFGRLTEEKPFRGSYESSELLKIIDSCREPGDQVDPQIWEMVRASLLDMAQKFLKAEGELRHDYPCLSTEGREVSIEADWDLKRGELVERGQGDYEFKGRIDRVDTNGDKEASVIDYKSSSSNVNNFKSWVRNDSLQLSVYAQAVEKGLTELGSLEVCSAFYYVGKDMSCKKGFGMKDRGGDLFGEARVPNVSLKSALEIQAVQKEIMSKIQETVQSIEKGDFEPRPKKKENCKDCHWRRMCRAPHLI